MKLTTILLFFSFAVSAQSFNPNNWILYRANTADTVDITITNPTDFPKFAYLESLDSVYLNNQVSENGFSQFTIILGNNDIVKGRGESGLTYSITKPFTPVRDSTLIRFQTVLQNLNGFDLVNTTLTNAQIRALFAVLINKEQGLTPNGTIRIKRLLKE